MIMNTHRIMAGNILKHIDSDKIDIINKNSFVWGNIKPDCASKYKFKKHYLSESLDLIVARIIFLSSLKEGDIKNTYGINKFSAELGIVCHFLCDFFCLPHNQRWEFKSTAAVKDHMLYEKNLGRVAKGFDETDNVNNSVKIDAIRSFIIDMQKKYEENKGYENDLNYAHYVCNSIVTIVISTIMDKGTEDDKT